MTGGDVFVIEINGGVEQLITAGHTRSYLQVSWDMSSDHILLCAAIEDGEPVIGRLSLGGEFTALWRGEGAMLHPGDVFTHAAAGERVAFTLATPRQPADVHVLALAPNATPERITDTNPGLGERVRHTVTTLHWRAFDGQPIQGLLLRPSDASDGALPLITLVHGGPTSLWQHGFYALRSTGWATLLAERGYAVLLPNPRGSMGFGTAFAEANIGDMGGGDWADVMAGVDYCIAEGLADGERLGLAGWSYGGYMTAWGVTQTKRFKAAVAGASITNWISFHGVSTIPGFDATFYPGDPFNWDGPYGQFSPMAHIRNVTTPTLFLHGEQDPICPVGQAHEMFRALKELGVETQLVVYPREGHGMRERPHARDVLERAVEWLASRV
jgi:dipeptidyl aminopeptidase/acylaminoacyl peptidase